MRRSHRAHPGIAAAALVAALCAGSPAGAAPRTEAPAAGPGLSEAAAAARVASYWTPRRMRNARPLDLVVGAGGEPRLRVGPAEPTAAAGFLPVGTPDLAPYSFSGRIFIRRGKLSGYCSGTAIDSPTRQLVLTAGHCINSGREAGEPTVWSDYLQFVPAYDHGRAPFGAFVARRSRILAPRQWTVGGNPDFDLGAFLTLPNAAGDNVADAVGGGATIVANLSRTRSSAASATPAGDSGCRAAPRRTRATTFSPTRSRVRPPSASAAAGRPAPAVAPGWSAMAQRSTGSTPTST